MKRSQGCKNVNRRNIFNHLNRNVVYPSLYLSPGDMNKQTTVEIKELRSDEDSDEQPENNYSHVWRYNDEEQDINYKINKEARERRRVQNDNEIYNELFDQMCTEFYGIDCHRSFDGASNEDKQCFAVIKNQPYDTSSDEEYDVEILNDDLLNIYDAKNEHCTEGLVNYSNGFKEKRTIWIFSEKNRRALSEHDYELINMPDIDSSSTITEDDEPTRDINVGIRRLATPIPTYIPKLCLPLSPTLPTVTEVVEIKSSNASEVYHTPQMPRNNWVQEETDKNETGHGNEASNMPNTLTPGASNIMPNTLTPESSHIMPKNTLTPREKRRLKYSVDKTFTIDKVVQDPKVNNNDVTNCNPDVIEKVIKVSELNEFNTDKVIGDELDLEVSSEKPNYLQKPQIKVNQKTKPHLEIITEPLEKLDGHWIGDEVEKNLDIREYDVEQNAQKVSGIEVACNNSVANKFSVSNMALMKPAAWTQYLPITGSLPSLHLSFETDHESENKSCLKRFFKYVNCCRKM